MTVPELLTQIGHPLGRRGQRTTCPIHQGHNDQAFSYSDHGWVCFSGCGSGGVRKLAIALGIEEELAPNYRIEGLEGIDPSVLVSRATVTDAMTRYVLAERARRDDWACRWHRAGLSLVNQAEATLALVAPFPDVREALEAQCGDFLSEARVAFDKAHAVWGAWPWPCGCYEGASDQAFPADWGVIMHTREQAETFRASFRTMVEAVP